MANTFKPGDYLILVTTTIAEIRPGDIVVFHDNEHLDNTSELVHRIVMVRPNGLVAKGDNNTFPDKLLVTNDNLIGRVTMYHRNGKNRVVLRGQLGLLYLRVLRVQHVLLDFLKKQGGSIYPWLRNSNLLAYIWKPIINEVSLITEEGQLVKYICKGKTVGQWWPEKKRFECKKPYDLVIPHPVTRV